MGLLSSFKRIYKGDFQAEYQELIEQLSFYINTNTEVLFQTLNNNVTLKDNVYGQVVDLLATTDANGTPSANVGFTNKLSTPIIGLSVLNATSTSGSAIYPDSGIFCSFTQSGKTITLNNIKGLPAGQEFTLKIVAYG